MSAQLTDNHGMDTARQTLRATATEFAARFEIARPAGMLSGLMVPAAFGPLCGGGKRLGDLTAGELKALGGLCGAIVIDAAVTAKAV